MTDRRFHPLQWAEYAFLGLTVITALFSGGWFLPLLSLAVAVALNTVDRFRWQALQKKRLVAMARQIQGQREGERKKDALPAATLNDPALQDNLFALEQSLNGIVQYLNHDALRERVEHLEKSYALLRRALVRLTETPEEEIAPAPRESESSVVLPTLNISPAFFPTDAPRWECSRQIEAHGDAIAGIALTPDDRYLISAGWDRYLQARDLATGNLITSVEAHDAGILALALSGEGEYSIATGGFDRTVKVWTLADSTLQLQHLFLGHQGSVHALSFAGRAGLLVSGGYDGLLKQWSLDEDTEVASSIDELGAIYSIAVTGEYIAGAGADGTVTIWGVRSGEKFATLAGNVSSVKALAIAGDGRTIAAACVDGSVKVWDYPGGGDVSRPIRVWNAHPGQVTALVFDAGGQSLFTGGTDGRVAVWRSDYQRAIATLPIFSGRSRSVSSLARSSDDRYLIAGCGDGTIGIWERTG